MLRMYVSPPLPLGVWRSVGLALPATCSPVSRVSIKF